MQTCPRLVVTAQDFARIQATIRAAVAPYTNRLAQGLSCAEIVGQSEMAPKIVTMNSELIYEDVVAGTLHTMRVVYPYDHDPERGKISVLEPLGIAVLGLREGQQIDWMAPSGVPLIRIITITYQPEAAGDWSL